MDKNEQGQPKKRLKPYELLENVLLDIENGIKDNINAHTLSQKYGFSEGYLRSLFSFAFKQSMSAYIRSRTLAASLDDILETNTTIIDIALAYGFEYEQSYIRAFRREFGISPGYLRKTGRITKIKPPLHLFDENKLGDSLLFGPDIVMVPRFHIIGKRHMIPFENPMYMALQASMQFMENDRKEIKGAVNPNVCIGFARNINVEEQYSTYMTSVQVKNLETIPEGFYGDTFETSLCVRFRYIGPHPFYDTDEKALSMIRNAINKFAQNKQAKYELADKKIQFEMTDIKPHDGTYCQMEWYCPVFEKQ